MTAPPNQSSSRARLLVAVTASQSAILLRGQLAASVAAGFEVYLLSAPGEDAARVAREEGAQHLELPIAREMRPARDLVGLIRIVRLLHQLRPDIVNAGTPKAGLLVGLAAWLTRVPVRVHTLRGLRFETQRGASRAIVRLLTGVTCATAHRVICVSSSLREQAIAAGVVSARKAVVLGHGSSNGVDIQRFRRTPEIEEAGAALRRRLGIPADGLVIGYVGRIASDKGVDELTASWIAVRARHASAHLVVVGGADETDPVRPETRARLDADPRVHLLGQLGDVRPAYAAMDVLVLPSHREGFPNVLLEAAAMRLPVAAYDVTGSRDAVVHCETGILVPSRDAVGLATALARYLDDSALREQHGAAGERRARTEFHREVVWTRLHAEYRRLLVARGRPSAERRRLSTKQQVV